MARTATAKRSAQVVQLRLVPAAGPDQDTIDCLRALLSRAEAGEIVGLAYAAMATRRGFIVNTAGEAHRNPTFARGMVRAIDDELRRLVWGER